MAARQLGWLHSIPESGQGDKKQVWPHSRLEQYRKEGKTPPMPTITAGQYLIDALLKMGPTKAGGMGGEMPVEWLDIFAFSMSTRDVGEPWEMEALHQMSGAYLEGKTEGQNVFSKPPMERG